jgi:hypothetical protein
MLARCLFGFFVAAGQHVVFDRTLRRQLSIADGLFHEGLTAERGCVI